VINIAQTGPRWVAKLNLVDSRGPRVPSHGIFGCSSVAEVFVGRIDQRRYSKIAVGKGCRMSISAGDLQEVRYAR